MYHYRRTLTNDETYLETFTVFGDDGDEADISGWDEIEFIVRDDNDGEIISLSIGDGITVDEDNSQFTVRIEAETLTDYAPSTLKVGCRYTEDDTKTQILVGTIALLEGHFT